VAVIRRSRDILEKAANDNRVRFPRLDALRWRVDVSISSSSLSRVMQPAILMEMTLGDGTIRTFEVPVDQFHDLRFNVAKVREPCHKSVKGEGLSGECVWGGRASVS
jgi:hypothetical protein